MCARHSASHLRGLRREQDPLKFEEAFDMFWRDTGAAEPVGTT